MKYIFALICCFLLISLIADANQRFTEDRINVFDNILINFAPDNLPQAEGLIYLEGGRIVLKEMVIPETERYTEIYVRLRVRSNGDPWDKAGSVFVLHPESSINMLNLSEANKLPSLKIQGENYPGTISEQDYIVPLELLRFITPFGAGYYSDHPRTEEIRPVYIPEWETSVSYEQNITDYLPLLQGEITIGVFIDTWLDTGFKADLELIFRESMIKCDHKQKNWIYPLINTVNYRGQRLPDLFSRTDLNASFTVPENVSNLRIHYTVTGHGGHQGGDEFEKRENLILLNDRVLYSFTPWRSDCASYRRFNPSSGIWPIEVKRENKTVWENIASSDLSRSGWCPGSIAPILKIPIEEYKGNNSISIRIIDAQEIGDEVYNYWYISLVVTGDIN